MKKQNSQNSDEIKQSKKILNGMTSTATFWAHDDNLKDEPETRIMSGIRLGLETKIYYSQIKCQAKQIEVKKVSRDKIKAIIDLTDAKIDKEDIDDYINDPEVIFGLQKFQ